MARRPQNSKPGGFRKNKGKPRRGGDAARLRGAKVEMKDLDYKNTPLLQRLTSAQGKLFSRKRAGLPAPAQRRTAQAVKRARFMALLPYVS